MTKKEIVKQISERIGLTQLKTKEIVQQTFDAIVATLIQEKSHRIELRNFGVFEVKLRKERMARNPRTGDKVSVPAKAVVTFKPGKEMEERVREIPLDELLLNTEEREELEEEEELEDDKEMAEGNGIEGHGDSVSRSKKPL